MITLFSFVSQQETERKGETCGWDKRSQVSSHPLLSDVFAVRAVFRNPFVPDSPLRVSGMMMMLTEGDDGDVDDGSHARSKVFLARHRRCTILSGVELSWVFFRTLNIKKGNSFIDFKNWIQAWCHSTSTRLKQMIVINKITSSFHRRNHFPLNPKWLLI